MFSQAEQLLGKSKVKLLNTDIQEAFAKLDNQDAFIFCRSFYAYSGEIDEYKVLFLQLKKFLSVFGQLFIYEIDKTYNIPTYKKSIKEKLINHLDLFHQHWPILEDALLRFNDGIKNKEFTLFYRDLLEPLAYESGFELLYYNNLNIYYFRKRYCHSN